MKACAVTSCVASCVLTTLLSFTGCSRGGAAAGPPAETPASAAPAGTEEPTAPAQADEAAPAPVASPATTAPQPDEPAGQEAGEEEAATVQETRTTAVIAEVVRQNREPARACYDKVAKDAPGLKGELVIHFVLNPDGTLKTARLNGERSTLRHPAVADCVIEVIRGLKFPESSRGMETTVNYPFQFNPR